MILQGGFDIEHLARSFMFVGGKLTDALVLVTANRDLELRSFSLVVEEMDGSLTPHLKRICELINPDEDAFCGIVHAGTTGPVPDFSFMEEAQELDELLEPLKVRLISHIYVAEESWLGVRGMTYFDLYSHDHDVPSTMNSWTRSPDDA